MNRHFRKVMWISLLAALPMLAGYSQQTGFKLNDLGVFKKPGVDLMIYNDSYNSGGFFDEKVNGIEMIQHEVRTVTGGAVRLSPTPEQWDLTPTVKERTIKVDENTVTLTLYYKEFDFTSKIKVEAKDNGCLISVILDNPVPKQLEGKAGMNMEFLPSAYFKKTYIMDGQTGICPLVPTGPMVYDAFSEKIPQFNNLLTSERFGDTYAKATPFALGKKLVLSPDDPLSLVTIKSLTGSIGLLDGRNLASNGWLVVQEIIPAGKTGMVIQWMVTPNGVATWVREPVISHSQVGYHPDQQKVAVIELDAKDTALTTASLYRMGEDGNQVKVLDGKLISWGKFLRYNYLKFDFSAVRAPGIYKIQYGNTITEPFPIGRNVYENIWHPTLDTWLPVQMDHMVVKEAYRVWHGNPHKDDALQAPTDTMIHDGYRMGSTTGTKYKPYEHIPGLNMGGWFDAGDFDIQTGSHNTVIGYLVSAWEDLKPMRDETMVDKERKYVAIHHPDGVPDLLQQIEHGSLALVAQFRAFGHAIRGIVQPHLWQYNMIGDASNLTDGLIYNPDLKPFESDGFTSGTMDDRWAFTNTSPMSDIGSAAALAAASRALKSYNDELANECLEIAQKVWEDNVLNKKAQPENQPQNAPGGFPGFGRSMSASQEVNITVELLLTTGDKKYSDYLAKIWPEVKSSINGGGQRRFFGANPVRILLKAIPYMNEDFKNDMRKFAINTKRQLDSISNINPYGVPLGQGGFYAPGSNFSIMDWSLTNAKLHQFFPDIISEEYAIRGLNYILGCHPASSISFVSGVGVNSKKITYGNNRADFTYIPGGMVPGNYMIKPDFYENKEDWPFIWYENEVVVDGCAGYIYLAAMVNNMLTTTQQTGIILVPRLEKPLDKKTFKEKDLAGYLLVYFKDQTQSAYMAISTDGYSFTDINSGQPVFIGSDLAEQKGVRDPHITRGPDGAFYLAMTDLHIFGKRAGFRDTDWERPAEKYGWGNNRALVLMKSYDLIHWTHADFRVDKAFPELGDIDCSWAPETVYDPVRKKMMVYFTIRYNNKECHLYYAYPNDDFTKLDTKPERITEIGGLDGDITKTGDQYHLFYVSDAKILHSVSGYINKGFKTGDRRIDPETVSTEAPNVFKRLGTGTYVLMYDVYGARPSNMGFSETTDFVNFTNIGHFNEGIMKTTNFSSPKHGAVTYLTKDELKAIAEHWKLNIKLD